MGDLFSIALVLALFLLGVISPGPNFLVVTQQSLNRGFHAGMVTGIGVAFGDCIYAFAGLFGLTTLMSLSGWLFGLIKILGGLYLIYLGIGLFKAKKAGPISAGGEKSMSLTKCFRLGLLTDLANPKTIVFFAGIFASTVNPSTPTWVLVCMLTGITTASIIWRMVLSFLFSRRAFRNRYLKFRRWFEMAFGAILIIFGLKMTTSAILQSSK